MATDRRHLKKHSDLLMEAVADKVRRGLPLKQACRDYGMGVNTIRNAVYADGERPPAHKRTSVELRRRMRVMRAEGMKYREIAEVCGVSINTAWRYTYDIEGDR